MGHAGLIDTARGVALGRMTYGPLTCADAQDWGLLRCGGLGRGLVEALSQGVPGERGALDAHRELHHALKGLEVTELDVGLEGDGLLFLAAVEALLVNRHHGLEGADEGAHL